MKVVREVREGGVHLLRVSGVINFAVAPDLESEMRGLVEGGAQSIVLDLSQVEMVSSAGLRVFLLILRNLTRAGGALVLFGLHAAVREVFEVSGLLSLMSVHETEDEALAATRP